MYHPDQAIQSKRISVQQAMSVVIFVSEGGQGDTPQKKSPNAFYKSHTSLFVLYSIYFKNRIMIEDLIIKHLREEQLHEEERNRLYHWVQVSERNKSLFNGICNEELIVKGLKQFELCDSEAAWIALKIKLKI